MYIKDKIIDENKVLFKISPVFSSEELVKRCRMIVDDYFTFVKFDTLSKNYDFRKYCLNPVKDEYRLTAIEITELLYAGNPFSVKVHRNGDTEFYYPVNMAPENKELFINHFERMLNYAL